MTDADLIDPTVTVAGSDLLELLTLRRRQGDHPIRLFMADTGLWRVEFLPGYWLTDPEQSLLPLR